MNEHIKRATRSIFSSSAAFAKAIDRSPQFVSQLLGGERPIPADLCPVIEREVRKEIERSGSKEEPVLCEQLRPDVAWEVVRSNPATVAEEEG